MADYNATPVDRKCKRHPRHDESHCPHHGRANEEDCYCATSAGPGYTTQAPGSAVVERINPGAAAGPWRDERPMKSWECVIHVDGLEFTLSIDTRENPEAVQRAASKIAEALSAKGIAVR